jgi:hypothetical protein
MPQHWTLDEAKEALPEVRATVQRIRELVATARDETEQPGNVVSSNGHGPAARPEANELRQKIEELTSRGIVVRDPARGLIDFPALTPTGRTYLLCWLDGEDDITWWHWPDDGFAGRAPLSEPPG